jgi:hypothetical protein
VKRWIVLLNVVWLVSVSWAQKSAPLLAPLTVIRAGVLIDGVSGSAHRDQVITIRGNMTGGRSFELSCGRHRHRPLAGHGASRVD